jgi:hypothetical protein
MTPHYKKGQAPRSAKAFCRFPWDASATMTEDEALEVYERSRVSEEEAEALNKHFDKLRQDGKIR